MAQIDKCFWCAGPILLIRSAAGTPERVADHLTGAQDLRHPVVVDKHATDHQVLSLHYHEALGREQPPGELAGLGEQARYSLLAGRRLHGVIQP